MNAELGCYPPNPCSLQARGHADPAENTLVSFAFRQGDRDGWWLGLPCLGGSLSHEHWQSCMPVQQSREGLVHLYQAGDLLFMRADFPDEGSDLAPLADAGYALLLELAARHKCPHLLRAWNYLPDINRGDSDQERYRRFCLGRAQALEGAGYADKDLCAGTAIGSRESRVSIGLLTSASPGVHIENPRQISAWRYPKDYGPRSPSFARATALPQANGNSLLMISGTASVIGHETRHPSDPAAQLDETIANLQTILETSALRLRKRGLASFGAQSLLRVYVRHAEHWPGIQARLQQQWPLSPLVGLHGDICRSDLLLEIEAVTRG